MKKLHFNAHLLIGGLIMVLLIILFLDMYFFSLEKMPALPDNPLYKNSQTPVEDRITDLMSYMTLDEKIGQMALVEKGSVSDLEDVNTYAFGAILSGSGSKPEKNTFEGWRMMVQEFTSTSRASRLGIPILYGVDAIHGHSNVPGATLFPHSIGLGASGNESLVYEVAQATGKELIATGITWSYSPTLDMPEDIRWGRTYESFSDDPVLVGRLGVAYVQGMHSATGQDSSKVLATAKHYLGLGGMQWNTSSSKDYFIDQGVTPPDETKLRTTYLAPFTEVISAGVHTVMVGLNSWGSTKLAAERYLLTDLLKSELGFEGFLVSDWYGVYEIPGSDYRAAITAIRAGVDMVMLPFDYKPFIYNVRNAVLRKEIPIERIDDAVRRILRVKFTMGLFDTMQIPQPLSDEDLFEHKTLARQAVRESLVLLKDPQGLLPLHSNSSTTIRITGSAADNIGRQAGAWTIEWQGVDGNWIPGATSILQGLRGVAGPNVTFEYSQSGTYDETSPVDIGIAIVGERPYAEGWGDNTNPSLSDEDVRAIANLQKVCKRIIVILVTGRPLLITDAIDDWDAVVVAWLPGSEGAGVADVLYGVQPFTGSLPLPWPAHIGQLPIVDGKTKDGTSPLFPRYFGLR
ncbi:TPA: beta-glucosidase [Patescibacteria group bacterium]|nr:MAG: Glycoside hydrolase family 3 domain protein [Parcubacteria group bacterium GW2011_GWD2_42_14]HCC05090.1 beta-glucosidase [Patescibacteria group bacterium]